MRTLIALGSLLSLLLVGPLAHAQVAELKPDEYATARVSQVQTREDKPVEGSTVSRHVTLYTVELLSGAENGQIRSIEEVSETAITPSFKTGDTIVVGKRTNADSSTTYYAVDAYRLPPMMWLAFLFFAVAIVVGKRHGAFSILGLGLTALVIIFFVVPRIASGHNPLVTSLIACFVIVTVSLYLGHGFNQRTSVALLSTVITLSFTAWIALKSVAWTTLMGTGSEDVFFLQSIGLENINTRGLLLGGIMLGVLGILDDITTAQSAVVDELHRANPKLKTSELYRRGISVGREHIASLINTLFLAYAGVSIPLFLLFSNTDQPLWFILNSAPIAEEIVRTVIGSLGLVLAVPLTTAIAAQWFGNYSKSLFRHSGLDPESRS